MPISITNYTEGTLTGTGVFDEMMRAVRAHLENEYKLGRIKGPEYSQVYLGAIQAVMDTALQYLLQEQRVNLEAQLLGEQIITEQLNQARVTQETANLTAQEALTEQQTSNLAAEALNIPKQGALLDAQEDQVIASTALETRRLDLIDEEILVAKEKVLISKEELKIAQAKLVNIPKEGAVLDGQKCKLDAEFDLLQEQKLKSIAETALLGQKQLTEQAQTNGTGVDGNSMIGKQIALYDAQRDGFVRDAEQKVAQIMTETWKIRRTTDEATVADQVNLLDDSSIGRAIGKLLTGVGA